jgi:HrpA-like RNA helicase
VVLRLKTLKVDDVLNFAYISKPSIEGLKRSIELLKLIGALSDKEDKVTKIGELLIKIPI